MALKDDINTYFKDSFVNLGIPDSSLEKWLQQGYRDLISKLPAKELERIKSSIGPVQDGTGHTLNNGDFLYAMRNGYRCRQVSSSQSGEITNVNSPNYATSIDPVCYIQDETVYIQPVPTSTENGAIYYMLIPAIDVNTDTRIGNLSALLTQFPVMYAAIRGKEYLLNEILLEIKELDAVDPSLFSEYSIEHGNEDIELANQVLGQIEIATGKDNQLIQSKLNRIKIYQQDINRLYSIYDKELKEYFGIQPQKQD